MKDISRRNFFGVVGIALASVVVMALPKTELAEQEASGYGLIEAKTYPNCSAVHVFLNGAEVTKYCVAANDIEGWVEALRRDEGGHVVSLETHRKYGNVLITIDGNS